MAKRRRRCGIGICDGTGKAFPVGMGENDGMLHGNLPWGTIGNHGFGVFALYQLPIACRASLFDPDQEIVQPWWIVFKLVNSRRYTVNKQLQVKQASSAP